MRTDEFSFDLPEELIAQNPAPRGESRMLVLHRTDGRIEHRQFGDLPNYLAAGDVLVLNDTRVTARRLRAQRESGLEAEILLLHPVGDRCWSALIRPGRALRPGKTVRIIGPNDRQAEARILSSTPEGGRILEFADIETRDALAGWGETPLPPYIHEPLPQSQEERYQTVYARSGGSAAAPTAGLHFTNEMLERVARAGIDTARLTLHVGVGTFRPVRTEEIEAHEMHAEMAELSEEASRRVNGARGRVVAVGTTSVRTLETAAKHTGNSQDRVAPFRGETALFITPGYTFRAVDAMITNFHLPESTLLMLVSAFAGIDATRAAYREAIAHRYRFFSFGDAMLIV